MLVLLAAAGIYAGQLTLGALEKRRLAEVGRDRILWPCEPSCTRLIPVIIMGPKDIGRRFVGHKRYLCEVQAGQAERDLV